MARINPLGDRVLVRRIESEQKTDAGIIIPDTAQEKTQIGEVVAAGPGKILENGTRREMSVKAGQKVLFGKYSGTDVKVDGEEFLILREDEVLAVIE